MGPSVGRGPGLVLAGIGVQHPAASHHVGDHIEIAAQISITEIRKNGAVAMHLFHIIGETLFRDAHEKTLAQVLQPSGVKQGEVDLGVFADRVAEVPHTEVQVVSEHLLVFLPTQGTPGRRALRILGALHVL